MSGNSIQAPLGSRHDDFEMSSPGDEVNVAENDRMNPFRNPNFTNDFAQRQANEAPPPRNVTEGIITVAPNEHRRIDTVDGDSSIQNNGKLTIGTVAESGSLMLPDNTGRVRVGTNAGKLSTTNNTGDITLKNNSNEMSIQENKGVIKVQKNDSDGHMAVGDPTHAGLSQGGIPGLRHSGRVTVESNNGTLEQHYGAKSLGSMLHYGGPNNVDLQGSVRLHPSGPGGKLNAPLSKATAAIALGAAGVATTYAVGGANALGLYDNASGLAHPTHPMTTTALPPATTAAHNVGLSSTSAHSTETPHIVASKFGKF